MSGIQITPRSNPQGGKPQATQARAAATSVDALPNYIPAQRDPTLQGLLQGLSTISPIIEKKLQEVKQDEAGQATADREAGKEAQSSDWNYTEHYMHTDGLIKGQEDAVALKTAYDTEFDKDAGNLDEFIKQKYTDLTKGTKPGPWLAGHDKYMSAGIEDIRKEHLKYQNDAVVGRVESNAMTMLGDAVTGYMSKPPGLYVGDLTAKDGEYDPATWGTRPDGSTKGKGFLGALKRPDGAISTEISVGVNIDGKEMDIPTMVPTLSRPELDKLMTLGPDEKIPESIVKKAADHAKARIAAGKSVFADDSESGLPPDPSVQKITELKGYLGKHLGVSNTRFDQLLFATVQSKAQHGRFDAYELLKQNHADGTPGLYANPEWKHKIDAAQDASYSYMETQGKRDRAEQQDKALYSVFEKLYAGDSAGARAELDAHRKAGLFTTASELVKWEDQFSKTSNKEARADQQAAELEVQAKIYQGKAGIRDIIAADLTPAQKRALLSEAHRVQQDARMVAATAEKEGKAIFRSSEFRSGEEYIKGALAPQPDGGMDYMRVGTVFDRQQKAAALLEFSQAAQRAQSPQDLNVAREEIASRYLKRRKEMPDAAKGLENAGLIRYSTPAEAAKALREGKLSFEEGQLHLQYFKAPRTNAR